MAIQTVQAIVNGQTYNLTYNSSTSKWEATITAPSTTSYNVNANHYYPISITATNSAGTSTSKNDTDSTLGSSLKLYVKERVAPTISVQNPSNGAKKTTATPTIQFQIRDEANGSGINLSSLKIRIDSGSDILYNATGMTCTPVTNGYDCSYVVQSALSDGGHTVYINISDNDGNNATQSTTTFSIDTVPPPLNIASPASDYSTNNATLTVSGTTSDITSTPVTVTIKLNGTDQGAVTLTGNSFSKNITLANGANTIIIRSTDTSGLYSEVTRNITLDTSAPIISAVTITPNPLDAGATYVVTVTVTG